MTPRTSPARHKLRLLAARLFQDLQYQAAVTNETRGHIMPLPPKKEEERNMGVCPCQKPRLLGH